MSDHITEALGRIIDNDNDTFDGRGNVERVGLYNGSRMTVLEAYATGYDASALHWTPTTRQATAGYHHGAARTAAVDALKEYIEEVLQGEQEPLNEGCMLTATLCRSALDQVDWRDLVRGILNSIGENREGYHQLPQEEREATILRYAREATA